MSVTRTLIFNSLAGNPPPYVLDRNCVITFISGGGGLLSLNPSQTAAGLVNSEAARTDLIYFGSGGLAMTGVRWPLRKGETLYCNMDAGGGIMQVVLESLS